MGYTGDALSEYMLLPGSAVAAVIAAITAPPGWRAKTLWGCALGLVVLSVWLWIKPDIGPVASVLFHASNAITVIVVVGLVALMQGRRHPLTAQETPTSPPVIDNQNQGQACGMPNTSLRDAVAYVGGASAWGKRTKPNGAQALQEIVDKLHLRELSAWGRPRSGTPVEYIPWKMWESMRLDPVTGCALVGAEVQFHDVQFDLTYLHHVWPYARA